MVNELVCRMRGAIRLFVSQLSDKSRWHDRERGNVFRHAFRRQFAGTPMDHVAVKRAIKYRTKEIIERPVVPDHDGVLDGKSVNDVL